MKEDADDEKRFSPTGLKVLVVDDDPFCLTVLDKMLRECNYTVTTCNRATTALTILRQRRNAFDVVISDVHMPDMDGFKLLELIGLEMGLPVIMMSANGETDVVMKGVLYGACDYLVKPVRIEELRNIWQHVVRKHGGGRGGRRGSAKDVDEEAILRDEEDLWEEFVIDEAAELPRALNKKRRLSESDEQQLSVNSSKKARVVWSFELHQQFVKAINHLGIDKAVPKRILEVMNIQGLTRENIASHLQKYRIYLKRLRGVTPEPFPIASFQAYDDGETFGGTMQVQSKHESRSLLRTKSGPADFGTVATLKQLQALQQAAHEKGQIEAAGLIQVFNNHSNTTGNSGQELFACAGESGGGRNDATDYDPVQLNGRGDYDDGSFII